MKAAAGSLALVLSFVAIVLVLGQVDTLQTTGASVTTGAISTFFATPVMLVLVVLAVFAVMAAVFVGSRLL